MSFSLIPFSFDASQAGGLPSPAVGWTTSSGGINTSAIIAGGVSGPGRRNPAYGTTAYTPAIGDALLTLPGAGSPLTPGVQYQVEIGFFSTLTDPVTVAIKGTGAARNLFLGTVANPYAIAKFPFTPAVGEEHGSLALIATTVNSQVITCDYAKITGPQQSANA